MVDRFIGVDYLN
ncbi:hypothetical protein D039_2897A, partial [Vibrio parahaemolyticus EKP-028]